MNRLLATMRTDLRLQHRNGFYYAVAFVLILFAILMSQLPAIDWTRWLPPVVLGNLVMVSFFFIGGLVLLEKGEGTLEAQVVTPLRVSEYLGSKVVTLALLSLVENLVIVSVAGGFGFRFPILASGILGASVIYTLIGFVAVARYDSINEYIMPATLVTTLLSLPYLDYFGIWTSPLMLLHPLQGCLIMMEAGFVSVPSGELIAGVISAGIWIAIASIVARRAFRRFVIRKEGTR